jgi:hypothetical protein
MSCLHNSSSSTFGIVSISPDRRTRLTRSREDYSLQTNLLKMPKSHVALEGTPCGRRKCGTRESAASGQKCRHSLAPNLLARGREDAKMRSRIEEYTCTHRSNMNLVVAVVLQHELVSPPLSGMCDHGRLLTAELRDITPAHRLSTRKTG